LAVVANTLIFTGCSTLFAVILAATLAGSWSGPISRRAPCFAP
jgi:hypothetical protein